MRKTLQKIFLAKQSLITFVVIALVLWVTWGFLTISVAGLLELLSDAVIYIALIVGILVAFAKGETNIQKALIGAIFLLLCNSSIEIFLVYRTSGEPVLIAINALIMVMSIIIFISHLILQSDHVGSSRWIFFNQCCAIIIVLFIIYNIRQAFFVDPVSVLDLTFIPAWGFTYLIIICLETRIQVYKMIRFKAREEGTWDDQARQDAKAIFKL